jgi:hypothetical protein
MTCSLRVGADVGLYLYSFLTPALAEVGDQPHTVAAAPIVQEAGWASRPVWLYAENLSSTGFRTRNLPARR